MSDLREEWTSLRARRPDLARPLQVYEGVIAQWARWPPGRPAPLGWSERECRDHWRRGLPLLAGAPPSILPDDAEEPLATAMACVVAVHDGTAGGLKRLAEAWDGRDIGPADFLPAAGRVGAPHLAETSGLSPDVIGFIACAMLRPALESYFASCRPHLGALVWERGTCPFCGGPPAFSDILEDGQRRLACHLCGSGWIGSRGRCPFCGRDESHDRVRLEPTNRDQGYVIIACRGCRAYLKELDRRVRWDGGSALVEDWGSPHLDVVAERAGYWRPAPPLLRLA